MNKKVYIKPNSKQTVISNESLLADSGDPNSLSGEYGGDDKSGETGEAAEPESKLFNWNSFDEF